MLKDHFCLLPQYSTCMLSTNCCTIKIGLSVWHVVCHSICHVSEPIAHMDTDKFIMKEQVTLIPLHFDVFVQIMITAYILYSYNMCPGV